MVDICHCLQVTEPELTSRKHVTACRCPDIGLQKNKFRGFSLQTNYTDCETAAAGQVSPKFASRICCVVSATDPYGS
jgi:hypothetical protein